MTHYEILGIEENATQEQIKSAYRTLAKKYHPDVNNAPNANAFFRLIQEAYETLNDPLKREEYDHPDQNTVEDSENGIDSDNDEFIEITVTYADCVKLKFAQHSLPIKILLIILRILMFPIIPVFSLFNWLFEVSIRISIAISWIISVLGVVGIGFSISDLVNHRPYGWMTLVMFILVAAFGHYFPVFVVWLLGKLTYLYHKFKEYAFQIKYIFRRVKS